MANLEELWERQLSETFSCFVGWLSLQTDWHVIACRQCKRLKFPRSSLIHGIIKKVVKRLNWHDNMTKTIRTTITLLIEIGFPEIVADIRKIYACPGLDFPKSSLILGKSTLVQDWISRNRRWSKEVGPGLEFPRPSLVQGILKLVPDRPRSIYSNTEHLQDHGASSGTQSIHCYTIASHSSRHFFIMTYTDSSADITINRSNLHIMTELDNKT